MNVIALNGSPNNWRNTYHAIKIIKVEPKNKGISTEIIHVGDSKIQGCPD